MSASSTTRGSSPMRSAFPELRTPGDDPAVIGRARAGDQRAFESLARPYHRELHVHCYRMVVSLQDAEDLVQQTLVRSLRNLHSFEGRRSLRAWLYKIATNSCLKHIRSRPRLVA